MDTLPDTLPGPDAATEAPPRRRRWPWVMLIALGLCAGGVGLGYRPFVRAWIVREAEARGVTLTFDGMDLGWERVKLTDVRARPSGIEGVWVTASAVEVGLAGTKPERIAAEGVGVTVEGALVERMRTLAAWARSNRAALSLSTRAQGLRLWWREGPQAAPWLVVEDATAEVAAGGGSKLHAPRLSVDGYALGAFAAEGSLDEGMRLGLGREAVDGAPLRVDVAQSEGAFLAKLAFGPMPVVALGKKTEATGSAKLVLGAPEDPGAVKGTFGVTLTNWTPPHPKELDGVVFGARTEVASKVTVPADRKRVELSETTLAAGAFKLAGGGAVVREGDHALVRMEMTGAIPCTELGASAVHAHVGKGVLGSILAGAARMALNGSVKVRVKVEADSRAPDKAKVEQTAAVGCSL
jgi:hypothetical protein